MSALARFIGLAVILSLAAFLVHTSSENPGTFHFVGFGWDVQMSATFAALLFAITLILTYFFGQTINYIINTPSRLRNRRGLKKAQGGLELLHQGFLALTVGDTKTAQKNANQAAKKLPNTALADLLTAQASQGTNSEDALHALTNSPTSALAGHVGLMDNAMAQQQWGQVVYHAEKVIGLHKNSPKAKDALLEGHLRQQHWQKAATYTDDAFTQASLTLLQAIALREAEPETAQKITLAGSKKAPDFVPLTMFAVGLYTATAQHKKAEQFLKKAFLAQPRLDLFARLMDCAAITQPDATKRAKKLNAILNKLPQTAAQIKQFCLADVALEMSDIPAAEKALNTARNYGDTRELCQRFAKLDKLKGNINEQSDWLQKALLAPTLTQAGDAGVIFWQEFRTTYTEQPAAALSTTPAALRIANL